VLPGKKGNVMRRLLGLWLLMLIVLAPRALPQQVATAPATTSHPTTGELISLNLPEGNAMITSFHDLPFFIVRPYLFVSTSLNRSKLLSCRNSAKSNGVCHAHLSG
jgi:hypothetical protein